MATTSGEIWDPHLLCERLVGCGIPLWRVAVFVTTLHPDILGRRFLWQADTGVTTSDALFDIVERDDYRKSPFATVFETRKPLRRRLADADCPVDFAILNDLRAEGVTDYAAFPLLFTDGTIHVATWSTKAPGGFTAKQFSDIELIIAPLARVAEIRALRRTAGNLLDTYVGHQAGERILAGKIRRGHVEAIRAADLAVGHARLHRAIGALPPQALIDLLEPLFRLPGAGDPRSRRRGAQIHGRRAVGDFSDRRRRRRRSGLRRTLACAREFRAPRRGPAASRGETDEPQSASGSRCMSAR